jgi:hypothetical protein
MNNYQLENQTIVIFVLKKKTLWKNIQQYTSCLFFKKKWYRIDRAYFLFKMIANQPLVRIGTAVTNFALKPIYQLKD